MIGCNEPSIRAASWCAAQCVRRFAIQRGLEHAALEEFCAYLESLTQARDLPSWDQQSQSLAITGLGDPLPSAIADVPGLPELVSAAREVSASQIFGAWRPVQVNRFLSHCAMAIGMDGVSLCAKAARLQSAGTSGWGEPMAAHEVAGWSLES